MAGIICAAVAIKGLFMELGLIATLIGATALLVAIPGLNVAFIVADAIAYGLRCGVQLALPMENVEHGTAHSTYRRAISG